TSPATPAPGGDQGAAAVEMALVLPLLLLLLFGIIDFGRALNAQITLTEAAREGARAAALGFDGRARVTSAAGPVRVDTLDISACDGDLGADAVVSMSHAFRPVTPVGSLMGFFGGGSDGSFTIVARGVMPCVG
ncbi:TadE/TadG family type IV pilus assembly protein, partial [Couchioplanes caeruleus]